MKGLNLHIEMSHCVLRKTDQQQSSLRCILLMLADFKDEEQILKASKKKKKYKAEDLNWRQMSWKQYPKQYIDTAAFSKKSWVKDKYVFQVLKKNHFKHTRVLSISQSQGDFQRMRFMLQRDEWANFSLRTKSECVIYLIVEIRWKQRSWWGQSINI